MLPLVARSTMEVLALVPSSLREASLALGVPRWRTTLSDRPAADDRRHRHRHGARGRARRRRDGAAALHLVDRRHADRTGTRTTRCRSIPVAIFELSESPDPQDHARAWAAALVLLLFILFASLAARWLATRSRRKLSASR